jgi:hypothetical protein
VNGVSQNAHKSFRSEEEAREVFARELAKGNVRVVGGNVRATSSAAQAEPIPPIPTGGEVPAAHGGSPRQNNLARSRMPPVADGSRFRLRSFAVESEASGSARSTSQHPSSSSPPTGITQVVCLSSSSSGLSPLALRENDLEPEEFVQRAASRASSTRSSPGALGVAASVQSGGNVHSNAPITIHLTQHIHCNVQNVPHEHNLNDLVSEMAALGFTQESLVSPTADPRSPLAHPSLLAHPSSPR